MLVVCYITLKIGKVSCMLSGLISHARRYADSCVYCDPSCDRYHIADGDGGVVADPTSPQSIHPEPHEYFEGAGTLYRKRDILNYGSTEDRFNVFVKFPKMITELEVEAFRNFV